ncbi:MAG: hypothetical protein ACOZNI_06590 [Myxococcota bacterium]
MLLLLVACKGPVEEAPALADGTTISERCGLLIRDFHGDGALEQAEAIATWMDDVVDAGEQGYTLDPLDMSMVDAYEYSDELEPDEMTAAIVPRRTLGGLDDHAAVVPEADQSFADPSYAAWDRTITVGSEQGYLAGEDLETDNDIVKSTLGIDIGYPMTKWYRWVELERGTGQIFLSVITEAGWSDDGKNGVLAGFTIEGWVPAGDGEVLWYNATWTQFVTALDEFADDEFKLDQLVKGTVDYMEGTEEHVLEKAGE